MERTNHQTNTQNAFFSLSGVTSRVQSGENSSTGFFALFEEEELFVAAVHSLSDKGVIISEHYDATEVRRIGDICLLKISSEEQQQVPSLPLISEDYEITVGTKVYFAGYPLQENRVVCHKGTISSVYGNRFTIDGTIVPGHSGGPVVVRDMMTREFRILGMITSEAVASRSNLDILCEHKDPVIQKIGKVFEQNISTGIGWAIDIRVCNGALEPAKEYDQALQAREDRELEVKKPYSVVVGEIRMIERQINKRTRGVSFVLPGGRGEVKYVFTNDFQNMASYHGNETSFYLKALHAFQKEMTDDIVPDQFEFKFKKNQIVAVPDQQ